LRYIRLATALIITKKKLLGAFLDIFNYLGYLVNSGGR